jgi:hypothetical protein
MKTYATDVNTLNTKSDEIMGKFSSHFPMKVLCTHSFIGFCIGVNIGLPNRKGWRWGGVGRKGGIQ